MATKDETIKYWQEREKAYIDKALKDQKSLANESVKRFESLIIDIQAQIDEWFRKYATEQGISMAEAKKRVADADIARLQKRAKKIVAMKDISPMANEEMRIYNLTMRINRYQYLMSDIGITLAEFFSEEEAFLYEKFNELAIEEEAKQSAILGENVRGSARQIDEVVRGSYQVAGSGVVIWSESLWASQKLLKNILDRELTQAIILGENPYKVSQRIRKAMQVSKYVADRLARTEMARIQGEIQTRSYEKADVDKYIFIAEPTACEVCEHLDGRIFGVANKRIGKNFQPIHPNCRCSTAPYIDRDEIMAKLEGKKPPKEAKLYGDKAYKDKKEARGS